MLEKMDTELKIDYGSGVEDFDYEKFNQHSKSPPFPCNIIITLP